MNMILFENEMKVSLLSHFLTMFKIISFWNEHDRQHCEKLENQENW